MTRRLVLAPSRRTTSAFDYYRGYHAFWTLDVMGLPDPVLRTLDCGNALTLGPGLPATVCLN